MHDSNDNMGGMLGEYPPPNMANMMGGAMAELFGNIMGDPGMAGGHPGDLDEEDSDHDKGAAPDVNDVQIFAMLQQAGYGGMPGQSILLLNVICRSVHVQ